MSDPSPGPRVQPFTIGGTPALIVSDGPLVLEAPALEFDDLPGEVVNELALRHGLPADRMPLEQNALVAVLDGRPVLFDTGTGPERPFGPDTGRLIDSLGLAGLRAEDISAVVLTHIHSDHAWGLVAADGGPAFPNATVHVAADELAFVASQTEPTAFVGRHRAAIAACSDRLRPFDIAGAVVPGVTAIPTPGHTVGHTSYLIGSGRDALMVVGDLLHHPMLAERPDLTYRFDYDRARTVISRRALLARCAAEGIPILGYHFPWPGLGGIVPAGDGYTFKPA